MFARYADFCSSVPAAMMVGPAMPIPIRPTWSGASARASSSYAMAWKEGESPAPPYSFGHASPE
jgi:hypothetical protein